MQPPHWLVVVLVLLVLQSDVKGLLKQSGGVTVN